MHVERVYNGYIVTDSCQTRKRVFSTLDEVFVAMLMTFEGKYPFAGGESYGNVKVERGESVPPSN